MTITKHYRDHVRGHDYTIEFRSEPDGTYTLWALEHPPNPYGGSVTAHHLYESGEICVERTMTPRTLDRAIAIAIYWMNRFSAYVTDGRFPKTPGRINV